MCIGAAKSGTTTLYDILRQHPDVYIPSFKEPHFFDIPENFSNGLSWYEKTYFKKIDKKIIADFTPSYFFDKNAPKRIFDSLGSAMKFLVIIRNPIDRAYSHYLHSKRDFHETEDFEFSLRIENTRLNTYMAQFDYLSYLRHSYVQQGLYSEMTERYLQYFNLDNFLFISFEDEFLKSRDLTIKKILDFLEVDSSVRLHTDIKSNPSSKEKSKSLKIMMQKTGWWRVFLKQLIPSLKVRQIIKNRIQRANIRIYNPPKLSQIEKHNIYDCYFRDDISNLERILKRDFSYWIPNNEK
jgi:hypothetical protein